MYQMFDGTSLTARLVHVDIDNLWVIEREFGLLGSLGDPALIFERALPRAVSLFKERGVQATFFIVGRDFELTRATRDFLSAALAQGHEVANHSMTHPVNWAMLSVEEKRAEVSLCHELVANELGISLHGFRGPGYFVDRVIIEALADLNYRYDSSILPRIGPVLMFLYARFMTRGKFDRSKSFGKISNIFHPCSLSRIPGSALVEIPLSVQPITGLPYHTTFVYQFGPSFERMSEMLVRLLPPKYIIHLFHAIDFLDPNEIYKDNTKPLPLALRISLKQKMEIIDRQLSDAYSGKFITTTNFIDEIDKNKQCEKETVF